MKCPCARGSRHTLTLDSHPQSWNLYSYAWSNPLRNVDPSGLSCITLDDGSQGDDGDGLGCAGAGVAPGNPDNPNTITPQTVNVNAQGPFWLDTFFSPSGLDDFFTAGWDFIANSQLPLTGSFGVGLPPTGISIGAQISVACIPKTHRLCISGGVYATTPGSSFVNANVGVLAVGALDKAEDVVSGFGVNGTLKKSLHGGYQVSSTSSRMLGGPSTGTPGVSVSAGYGGCFTIGGQKR